MPTPLALTGTQIQTIIDATHASIQRAERVFNRQFPIIPIDFDLQGLKAGMFTYKVALFKTQCRIRFNPAVFALDIEHHNHDTVAHEVAHYIAHQLHGHRIRPHGKEWKRIAIALGCQPKATGHYPIDGIAIRRQRRFKYRCQCQSFLISTTLHRRIQQGQKRACKSCHQPLIYKEKSIQ